MRTVVKDVELEAHQFPDRIPTHKNRFSNLSTGRCSIPCRQSRHKASDLKHTKSANQTVFPIWYFSLKVPAYLIRLNDTFADDC